MIEDDRLPWFPCYASKLLGAFAGMKPDEGYIYWIVCLRIYEVNGPCPDTIDALARRSGMNKRRVADALELSFQAGRLIRQDAGIMNPFAAEVLADSIALHKRRVSAGEKGGTRAAEKRKQKQSTPSSPAIAPLKPNGTHLHLQEQIQLEVRKEKNPATPKAPPINDGWPSDFVDQFWKAFPPFRRQAKAKVAVKLARIRGEGKVAWQTIFDGVRKFAATNPGEFAPAPMVWLNDGRWDRVYGSKGDFNGKTQGIDIQNAGFAGIAARIRHGAGSDARRPAPEDLEPLN